MNRPQLDSLYNVFVNARIHNNKDHQTKIQSAGTAHIKCGFGIVCSIKANLNLFTPAQKAVLQSILERPSTDTSIVTPGGFFRIHYYTSGSDAPVYSIDSLAIALDSVYNFEVNYLGYPPPPSDNGAGGDDKYDIYITDLIIYTGQHEYGETDPENEFIQGSGRWTSYMLVQNDFSSYSDTAYYNLNYGGAKGINAARVTVAHEFHHAIQMGNYILRYYDENGNYADAFFYELTSTSMEHFVYPTIHDYFMYLPDYFSYTNYSFGMNRGNRIYALAIWNIFLKDNFGYGIIKKQWELMPQMRALQAIANSLADYNTSFGEQLTKFGVWTYYTNYRSIPNSYFEDAKYYPVILPIANLQMASSSKSVQLNSAGPVSNNFITIFNSQNLDSVVSLITNADVDKGINDPYITLPFIISLYTYKQDGSTKLTDNYFESFSADKPSFWLTSAIINNKVIDTGSYAIQNADYVFPSPFNYKKSAFIYIPAKPDNYGNTEVEIYNIAMKLVYSTSQKVDYIYGQKVVRWNALDNHNNKVSSGIYIYVTKSGNEIKKGKLVIFNE
jgi:hypothetical protein